MSAGREEVWDRPLCAGSRARRGLRRARPRRASRTRDAGALRKCLTGEVSDGGGVDRRATHTGRAWRGRDRDQIQVVSYPDELALPRSLAVVQTGRPRRGLNTAQTPALSIDAL